MKEIIGEKRENEWEILERATNHERLLTLGKELWEGTLGRGIGKGAQWV